MSGAAAAAAASEMMLAWAQSTGESAQQLGEATRAYLLNGSLMSFYVIALAALAALWMLHVLASAYVRWVMRPALRRLAAKMQEQAKPRRHSKRGTGGRYAR